MNLANILTMCRFALIPVYIAIFSTGHIIIAFLVVLLAGLTDILDGYIARKNGQVTQFGVMLDPLADKCMLLAVFISLLYSNLIPWQAATAMFIREVGMISWSAFSHFRGKKPVPANVMGKMTAVFYYIALPLIIFESPYSITFLWFGIAFSFVTSVVYIKQFKTINPKIKA